VVGVVVLGESAEAPEQQRDEIAHLPIILVPPGNVSRHRAWQLAVEGAKELLELLGLELGCVVPVELDVEARLSLDRENPGRSYLEGKLSGQKLGNIARDGVAEVDEDRTHGRHDTGEGPRFRVASDQGERGRASAPTSTRMSVVKSAFIRFTFAGQ
jgi:hypothetical protein